MPPSGLLDRAEARARISERADQVVRARLKPPPELSVSEWADRHRVLPDSSAEPGPWRTARTPYLREVMDAFSDPRVEQVVFMAAAQVGKSECLLNVLGYFIDQDPAAVLFVQEGDRAAAEFSKERIAPMIRLSPVLRSKVAPAKSRDSANTINEKDYPGGHLAITGAGTPGKLSRRPRRIVLFDEVDKYPRSAGVEGDPIDLGTRRTSTFWNAVVGLVSTPTIKGASRIEAAYLASDRRRYHVPCPACAAYQMLRWENIKWEKDEEGGHLPETARYQCAECEALLPEGAKAGMLSRGRWVAERPGGPVAGFQLSGLYSPFPKVTWGALAREFLEAKDEPERLKAFVNSRWAETYEERGEAPEWRRLYERREDYPMGVCPEGVEFLTVGADLQDNRLEIFVWGWGRDRESWFIEHIVLPGGPDHAEMWERATEVLHATWPREEGGVELPIGLFAVDTGYRQDTVVGWARKVADRRVMLVKGDHWKNWTVMVGSPSRSDVTWRGKRTGLQLWPVGGALIKQETYGFLRLEAPIEGEPYPPGWIHIPQVEPELLKQLVAEDLVTTSTKGGFAKREWELHRARNEMLDGRVYARAAAERLGLSRMVAAEPEGREKPAREETKREGEAKDRRGRWLDRRGGGRRGRGRGGWLK